MRSPVAREKQRLVLRQTDPGLRLTELWEQPLQASYRPRKKSKPSCAKSKAGNDLLSLAFSRQAPGSLCIWPWMQ